ncbi:MAG: Uma2 family endonuclease [Myxococcales bacterium]|nr:Uma2 family endonuclease [Myxococcales bacterium]
MHHATRLHRYTYADYVALERESPTKHEFLDGEIYAMAGGSEEHSALAAEVLRVLGNAVGEKPCRVTVDLGVGRRSSNRPSPAARPQPVLLLKSPVTRPGYDTGGPTPRSRGPPAP